MNPRIRCSGPALRQRAHISASLPTLITACSTSLDHGLPLSCSVRFVTRLRRYGPLELCSHHLRRVCMRMMPKSP